MTCADTNAADKCFETSHNVRLTSAGPSPIDGASYDGKTERTKKSTNALKIILEEKGNSSLDGFALEYYDLIAKPTLYQICAGKRDMKVSIGKNSCANFIFI